MRRDRTAAATGKPPCRGVTTGKGPAAAGPFFYSGWSYDPSAGCGLLLAVVIILLLPHFVSRDGLSRDRQYKTQEDRTSRRLIRSSAIGDPQLIFLLQGARFP
jgi:hypothetical protein